MLAYSYKKRSCFANQRGLSAGSPPPVTNGLLNSLRAYWGFNLGTGAPSFGPVSLFAIAPATATVPSPALISAAITCPVWGDATGGWFPTADLTTLVLNQNVSISVWARPNTISSTGNYGTLFQVANTNNETLLVAFEDDSISFGGFVALNLEYTPYVPPGGWTAGTWIHIVITHEASTGILKLYLNGAFALATTPRPAYTAAAGYEVYALSDFAAGGLSYGTFGGDMDEFGIWQKLLTPTDVTTLYNAGTGLGYPSFQT